jgi:predicted transcriptional regulator
MRNYLKDSDGAKNFLKIVEKESLPTTQIYKELNVSARKGNELKKELLMFGLIKEIEERNESGWKKFLKLTENGSNILARC